jgi:hypothetical protein
VILYVDDLLVGCAVEAEAAMIEQSLSKRFKMKALGDARFVLGMEINYNRALGKLQLRQSQFISRMVERFGQMDAFPVRNPSVVGQDLRPVKGAAQLASDKPYRQLIGSLLYVANGSRPDICAAVGVLSQLGQGAGSALACCHPCSSLPEGDEACCSRVQARKWS